MLEICLGLCLGSSETCPGGCVREFLGVRNMPRGLCEGVPRS